MTISSSSAKSSDGTTHIILKIRSDMLKMFGLSQSKDKAISIDREAATINSLFKNTKWTSPCI